VCDQHSGSPHVSRRDVLKGAGLGFGAVTLTSLLGSPARAAMLKAARASSAPLQLALVRPRNATEAAFVARLDDTHAVFDGAREYLLWPGDRDRLDRLGIEYEIRVPDLADYERRAREEARRFTGYGRQGPPGFTPRTTYRRLVDYETELHALADAHPALARTFTLENRTLEGRLVFGIEISANDGPADGRPTIFFDGVHHAREWPAGEYPMMFAHFLLDRYGTDPRVTALLDAARIAIVPIVNVDGFHYSRQHPVDVAAGFQNVAEAAYWRKNRRVNPGPVSAQRENGPVAYGVDPNRNYSVNWGRATSREKVGDTYVTGVPVLATTSPHPVDATYHGEGPLSEPETLNVARFGLTHNVTAYISNHTYQGLVLRPWGDTTVDPVDKDLLVAVGHSMASVLGYQNIIALELYPTTGAASDWMYAANGALSYTHEHGTTGFHPAYTGSDGPGTNWPKVMESYMRISEAGADSSKHCVARGRVTDVAGNGVEATLTLRKEFEIPISNLGADSLGTVPYVEPDDDPRTNSQHTVQEFSVRTRPDGTFEWHVGPSTPPLDAAAGRVVSYTLEASAGAGSATLELPIVRGDAVDLGEITLVS
jgi:hypothetical protein